MSKRQPVRLPPPARADERQPHQSPQGGSFNPPRTPRNAGQQAPPPPNHACEIPEDEYSKLISDKGGHTNAYTAAESTNYQFDVNADSLVGSRSPFLGAPVVAPEPGATRRGISPPAPNLTPPNACECRSRRWTALPSSSSARSFPVGGGAWGGGLRPQWSNLAEASQRLAKTQLTVRAVPTPPTALDRWITGCQRTLPRKMLSPQQTAWKGRSKPSIRSTARWGWSGEGSAPLSAARRAPRLRASGPGIPLAGRWAAGRGAPAAARHRAPGR